MLLCNDLLIYFETSQWFFFFTMLAKKMKLFGEILATVSTILSELVSQKLFFWPTRLFKENCKTEKR